MLDYLVTSRTRRSLLEVLWLDAESGSAAALARKAGISFASAYRELKEMARFDLVKVEVDHGLETYAANREHPMAGHLRALIDFRPRRYARGSDADDALRGQLSAAGVPIHGSSAAPPFDGPLEDLFARGARLARTDPTLAAAYPVGVWRSRHRLDPARLAEAAVRYRAARPLGFLLDVTADLGKDAALHRIATQLRDQRVRAEEDFFKTSSTTTRRASHPPAAARRWRYRVPIERDELVAMFEKYRAAEDP